MDETLEQKSERFRRERDDLQWQVASLKARIDEYRREIAGLSHSENVLMAVVTAVRGELRRTKQYAASDKIRDFLKKNGIWVKDDPVQSD